MRDDRGAALREIGTLFGVGTFAGLGDGALLDRFVSAHGEAAEAAFATIVERHGPMVLRVCKRVLKDHNDAEDAFQATFIALLRGAATIRNRESVASWLHGTALRVSAFARSSGIRRKAREGRSAELRLWERPDPACDDLRAAIVEEVGRLPDRYRMAVVLCDLEGLSHRDAAESLGWPVGTIKSRVTRGRERLKSRLIRRGLAPAVGLIGAFGKESVAVVGPKLAEATVALAMGQRTAGVLSSAMTLASLYQRSLIMSRIRSVIGIAAFGVLATGATLLAQGKGGAGRPAGAAGDGGSVVKNYPVGDLVLPDGPTVGNTQSAVDMSALIDVVTSTVAPGTWEILDANGQRARADLNESAPEWIIQPFPPGLSLIVRQTPEVHTQVADRIEMLRHLIKVRETNGERRRQLGIASIVMPAGPTSLLSDEKAKPPWYMLDSPTPQTDSQAAKDKRSALRLLYTGREAYKAGDFAQAEKSLEAGLRGWSQFLREHPTADVDYPTKDGLMRTVGQYLFARGQLNLPIPKDLPFLDLVYGSGTINAVPEEALRRGAIPPPPGRTETKLAVAPVTKDNPRRSKGMVLPTEAPMTDWNKVLEQGRAAQEHLEEGNTAYKAADFAQAMKHYEAGIPLWTDLHKWHPNYHDAKFDASEIERISKRWTNARKQLGLPDPKAAPGGAGMMGMGRGAAPAPTSGMPGAGGMPGMMMGMPGMAPSPSPGTETERRLRAVEEKLDRLLKVLDKPSTK